MVGWQMVPVVGSQILEQLITSEVRQQIHFKKLSRDMNEVVEVYS